MRKSLHAAVRWLAAAACAIVVGVASAQSPAVNKQEAGEAKKQAAQQEAQPLNNQPVWSEVRSGQPQFTSIPGRETNVLVQPQGQTWRALRVPLATAGGFLVVFALVVLGTFYLWRGPIKVHGKPTGTLIERFTVVERGVHWTVAIVFTLLVVSGLIITFGKAVLLPLIGYTLFSWLATLAKNVHNFVGPILCVSLPLMIALFVHSNLPAKHDIAWLKKGGGMLTGEHVPSGKANAGQKILFWLLPVFLGITLCVTGLILDFPNFNQTRSTMQIANVVHLVAGIFATCVMLGHAYLGTIGMKGAYEAMRTGYVDETWAREHHEYWYNDVKSKSGRGVAEGAPPAAAHRTA
jgi:formate dehydrogenase subunit gamma